MSVTAGNKIIPKDQGPNNLFAKLETIRAKHLTASQAAGSSTTGITSAFPTAPIRSGDIATRAATPDTISTEVRAIIRSGSFQANKGSFSQTDINPVPAVGDLISASNFNAWESTITAMDAICANYSRYGSHYGGRYGSHYGGQYGSHYGSRYGWYTQRYTIYSRGCLGKNTKILMGDLKSKYIQDISEGEEVISWNELTNKYEIQKVNKFFEHHDTKKLIEITFTNETKLILTPGHPILTTSGWKSKSPEDSLLIHNIYTDELNINDEIFGFKNQLKVKSIKELNEKENYDSYNLEIDNIHNFIAVLNEEEAKENIGVIVHNSKYNIAG